MAVVNEVEEEDSKALLSSLDNLKTKVTLPRNLYPLVMSTSHDTQVYMLVTQS